MLRTTPRALRIAGALPVRARLLRRLASTVGKPAGAADGKPAGSAGLIVKVEKKGGKSWTDFEEPEWMRQPGTAALLGCAAGGLIAYFAMSQRHSAESAENERKAAEAKKKADAEPAKQLINQAADVVREALDGMVKTYPHLARLDGYPEVKVVLRKDWDRMRTRQVAIISGGGSGHEPAHVGFVGRGMLTAAVCGDVFASPSVPAILAAIRAVARPGGPGALLIVKNYTGDRLNFGLAAEEAKAEGIPCEVVVVADDSATIGAGITGRRGIAGTVFVHKIAGSFAEAGYSLRIVAEEAKRTAEGVGSMGVALSTCARPGQQAPQRLGPKDVEFGLGIHGEPGAEKLSIRPVNELVERLLASIVSLPHDQRQHSDQRLKLQPGDRVALLVNNLGGATAMETSIATRHAINALERDLKVRVERTYQAPYMTALDMKGISLSVMKVDDKQLKHLDSASEAPAWINQQYYSGAAALRTRFNLLPMPQAPPAPVFSRPSYLEPSGQLLDSAVRAGARALIAAEPELTKLDATVGDGDCGQTLKAGAEKVLADLESSYPINSPAQTAYAMSHSISQSMGGTSGALYRAMFIAMHRSLAAAKKPDSPEALAKAFEDGVSAVRRYGGADLGYRTMLDALIPASRTLNDQLKQGKPWLSALEQAVIAAEKGAEHTKSLPALAGRSNYIRPELLAESADPGAKAAALWLRATYEALRTSSP